MTRPVSRFLAFACAWSATGLLQTGCSRAPTVDPTVRISIGMISGDADVIARIGTTEFSTLEDLERHLTQLPAGSRVRLKYYAGNLAGLPRNSKVPAYVAAFRRYCTEHNLRFQVIAWMT